MESCDLGDKLYSACENNKDETQACTKETFDQKKQKTNQRWAMVLTWLGAEFWQLPVLLRGVSHALQGCWGTEGVVSTWGIKHTMCDPWAGDEMLLSKGYGSAEDASSHFIVQPCFSLGMYTEYYYPICNNNCFLNNVESRVTFPSTMLIRVIYCIGRKEAITHKDRDGADEFTWRCLDYKSEFLWWACVGGFLPRH